MSCTEIEKSLSDYLNGELPEETRRLVKEHLGTCLSCRRTVTELRSLIEQAHQLPIEIEPEGELWPGIVSRITTAQGTGEVGEDRRHNSSPWYFGRNPLAVAAALLLAVAVPFTFWQLSRGSIQSRSLADRQTIAAGASSERDSATATALLARSEDGVLQPRADLAESLERQRDILPPETLRTIEESALLIDQAIAEVRTALNESPGDRQLELLLAARYQQEVALLKRVNRV